MSFYIINLKKYWGFGIIYFLVIDKIVDKLLILLINKVINEGKVFSNLVFDVLYFFSNCCKNLLCCNNVVFSVLFI